jgi:predicted RNase H-like nuclease
VIEAAPPLLTLTEVEAFIARNTAERTVIAIDAPLVIPNSSGQRLCELARSRQCGATRIVSLLEHEALSERGSLCFRQH